MINGRTIYHFYRNLLLFCLILLLFCNFAFALNLTLGPSVQNLNKKSAVITFFSDEKSNCAVTVQGKGVNKKFEDGESKINHQILLSGLRPSTRYRYQIECEGQLLSSKFTFKTAPRPSRKSNFKFAVFGDSGSGSKEQYAISELVRRANPAFILHTGDIVYEHGEFKNYKKKYFEPYKSIIPFVPIFPSVGNHDRDDISGFESVFVLPRKNSASGLNNFYYFDYGYLRFISLDSTISAASKSIQYRWLEKVLSSPNRKDRPVIIFFHHPPFSQGRHGDTLNTKKLIPLFEQYKVSLVLSGHDHAYERSEPVGGVGDWKGVLYIVSGGGGNIVYRAEKPSPNIVKYEMQNHFVLISSSRNELKGKAINLSGEVIDTFKIAINQPRKSKNPTKNP